GTRRAMAISKVALAGAALVENGVIEKTRIAAASLAAYPARLYRTEDALCGNAFSPGLIRAARNALLAEVVPIDDIRATAAYRKQVAANRLEEFLVGLQVEGVAP